MIHTLQHRRLAIVPDGSSPSRRFAGLHPESSVPDQDRYSLVTRLQALSRQDKLNPNQIIQCFETTANVHWLIISVEDQTGLVLVRPLADSDIEQLVDRRTLSFAPDLKLSQSLFAIMLSLLSLGIMLSAYLTQYQESN